MGMFLRYGWVFWIFGVWIKLSKMYLELGSLRSEFVVKVHAKARLGIEESSFYFLQ